MHRRFEFLRHRLASMLLAGSFVLSCQTALHAHHPDRENHPVTPIIDVIGPLGNNLKPSYRKRYNRPTYIGGKIAYYIAPSSQEAMAWHKSVHAGNYKKPKKYHRWETHYFYPKPWQVLKVGPRPDETVNLVSPSDRPVQGAY